MIDRTRLKQNYDLRRIVEQDLGQPAIRSGRASLYKCPFHGEQKGFSLAVWADGYRCFGKCDMSGDLFDWLMQYRQLTFVEVLNHLTAHQPESQLLSPPTATNVISTEPPSSEWQIAARKVMSEAEDQLWSSVGERALTYLLERGLTSRTIREARLGYVPGDDRTWHSIADLRVPAGIVIPWTADGVLWAVKIRRAMGELKYIQVAGGSPHGLYNADSLQQNRIALFCEGEFDTLILQQEAGDLISPVSLGSATARLTARWYGALVAHRMILVAYDRDEAGRRGTKRLLNMSPRFRELMLPSGSDVTDFYLSGGDVYDWIASHLELHCLIPEVGNHVP